MPAYKRKTQPTSCIVTREAWLKLKAAERRTGKSRSDVITHCLLVSADGITREAFEAIGQQQAAS